MKLLKKWAFLIGIVAIVSSCAPRLVEMDTERRLPRDFERFHQRFGRDSVFQLSRIPFPIGGLPDNADDQDRERWIWTRQNWVIHQSVFLNPNDYLRNFVRRSNVEIEEYIFVRNTAFIGTMRRFKRDEKGAWQLVFYTGLNAMPPKIEVLDLKIE